jgi:hypothetical protein
MYEGTNCVFVFGEILQLGYNFFFFFFFFFWGVNDRKEFLFLIFEKNGPKSLHYEGKKKFWIWHILTIWEENGSSSGFDNGEDIGQIVIFFPTFLSNL